MERTHSFGPGGSARWRRTIDAVYRYHCVRIHHSRVQLRCPFPRLLAPDTALFVATVCGRSDVTADVGRGIHGDRFFSSSKPTGYFLSYLSGCGCNTVTARGFTLAVCEWSLWICWQNQSVCACRRRARFLRSCGVRLQHRMRWKIELFPSPCVISPILWGATAAPNALEKSNCFCRRVRLLRYHGVRLFHGHCLFVYLCRVRVGLLPNLNAGFLVLSRTSKCQYIKKRSFQKNRLAKANKTIERNVPCDPFFFLSTV